MEPEGVRPRSRGRTSLTVLLVALVQAFTLHAGVLYEDSFDAAGIETNLYLGNIINGGGFVPVESAGSAE